MPDRWKVVVLGGILLGTPVAAQEEIPELCLELEVEAERERPAKVEEVTPESTQPMANVQWFSDVLKRGSGVDTMTGCPMAAPLITVRGNNSEWTQVLLDGVPTCPIGRPYLLNMVPMTGIERMEVIKGPAPPTYPGTTIAGVICLSTKTGDQYPGGQVGLTLGSYDNQIYELSAGGGDTQANYFVALNRTARDGWKPHDRMDFLNLTTKCVFALDAQSKLTVAGNHLSGDKDGFKPEGPNPFDKWAAEWSLSRSAGSLTYTRQANEKSDLLVRVAPYSFGGDQLWQQFKDGKVSPRFNLWRYRLLRTEVQQNLRPRPGQVWTWALSWQEDRFRFTDALPTSLRGNIPANNWHDYTQTFRSLALQNTALTRPETAVTWGLRYDRASPGGSLWSPFLSVRQRTDPQTAVRFAVTRNRRFPDLQELHGVGMWIGNPDLKPESGWTYQVDVDRILGPGFTLGASAYYMPLKNIVVADEKNQYQSAGKARLQGLELELRRQLARGCWWFNYTYLDAWDETADRPLITTFRTASPKHTVKFGGSLTAKDQTTYSLEALVYGSRRTDVDTPTPVGDPWNVVVPPRIGGYALFNAKATKPLRNGLTVSLSIENLLDREYQNVLFYPSPGRWINVEMHRNF